MKFRHHLFIPIIITALLVNPQPSSAAVGAKYQFELDPQGFYQMSAQASAPLVWPEDGLNEVNLTITIENLPNDNISGITIFAVNFILQFDRKNESQVLPESDNVIINQNYKNVSDQITISRTFDSPKLTDQFVIKIEILAITTGNLTQDINNPPAYSFFFPEEPASIFVERSQARALINLYGFPPTSFMLNFGFLLFGMATPMLIPLLVTLGYFVKDKKDERNKKQGNEQPEVLSSDTQDTVEVN
ncbi:MAG: hypothetical protein D6732_15195 [Methanobacteriota archaeon]|nr:MAG: hypothetical protein D6732_15195 [Euryarchaeota archaeon]